MSRKTIFVIIAVVVLLHVAAFIYFGRMKPLPKSKHIPPPNFGYREEVWEDPDTGEKTTVREIRVSTKLADEKTIARYRKQIADLQAKEAAAKEAAGTSTADDAAKAKTAPPPPNDLSATPMLPPPGAMPPAGPAPATPAASIAPTPENAKP